MATVKVTNDISAPVDVVFARFTDLQHGPGTVRGIQAIHVLTPGGFELGTRWREIREVLGRSDEAEMEVTAFEKDRYYTITHHKAGVRIDTTFTFEPVPAGTRVSIEFGLLGHGLPPGLLAPVEWAMAGKVRDVLTSDLTDLKTAVESVVAVG